MSSPPPLTRQKADSPALKREAQSPVSPRRGLMETQSPRKTLTKTLDAYTDQNLNITAQLIPTQQKKFNLASPD
jgi:hypothetical protein